MNPPLYDYILSRSSRSWSRPHSHQRHQNNDSRKRQFENDCQLHR